jgi:hypothetical protein
MTAFASVFEEDGVGVTTAELNGFTVSELCFPRGYDQPPFDPELPYVAVVLEGALVKRCTRADRRRLAPMGLASWWRKLRGREDAERIADAEERSLLPEEQRGAGPQSAESMGADREVARLGGEGAIEDVDRLGDAE